MDSNPRSSPLKDYEERKLNSFHIKTMLLGGAGQIVDGYDLTAGSLVLTLIEASLGAGLLSASLILFASIIGGNVVGGLLFGALARRGRKRFYGIDAMLMIIGSLLQAFVSTPTELAILRFILGVGIGADYVLSPLVVAEYSNRMDRGKLMGLSGGFMWNFGALMSVIATLALSLALPSDLLWRVVLASGSIPAIAVVYGRRKFPETPHYLAFVKRDLEELKRKYSVDSSTTVNLSRRITRDMVFLLFFASFCWYLYDVSAYSSVFFGPSIIAKALGVNGLIFELIILGAFAVPFNFLGAMLTDRVGRKPLQMLGFAGMGVFTLIFAFALSRGVNDPVLTLALYGASSALNSIGPGNIVGFWGVELFPAWIRGITQGVTVMSGRLGVITTTFLFPILLSTLGLVPVMVILGILGLVAVGSTFMLREPKQRSLTETEVEVERS